MELLGALVLWLHVTAATIWVGGNFMIAMVIVPYFKRSVSPVERIKIMTQIGRALNRWMGVCADSHLLRSD